MGNVFQLSRAVSLSSGDGKLHFGLSSGDGQLYRMIKKFFCVPLMMEGMKDFVRVFERKLRIQIYD